MKCLNCDCEIEEGEDQWTSSDDGPFCEDCIDDAEAECQALDFRHIM